MAAFARDHGGDSRFAGRCAYASALRPDGRARAFNNHGAPNECVYVSCTVLPGVLHTEAVWGNGTTEYSLDALLAAPHQVCISLSLRLSPSLSLSLSLYTHILLVIHVYT